MSFEKMQPTPTKTDVTQSPLDIQPCYLWIHLPYTPDSVITFPSIKQAYAFAEKYVYEKNARPLVPAEEIDTDRGAVWTATDDVKWISPDMYWDNTLDKIYDDIKADTLPAYKQWMVVSTGSHQMLIGLGFDLPNECINHFCAPRSYTLEDHDKPEDMPPLLRDTCYNEHRDKSASPYTYEDQYERADSYDGQYD
jgi:hypothetical protein